MTSIPPLPPSEPTGPIPTVAAVSEGLADDIIKLHNTIATTDYLNYTDAQRLQEMAELIIILNNKTDKALEIAKK